MQRKIRVLVGKPGLDGHDRGAKVVAAALRDAGMEVIYTGLHQTPDQIVEAAIQEDVDVVALSVLSGAHMTLFPEVLSQMRDRGIGDRLLSGGGIIPPDDMKALAEMGVGKLFGPGSSTQDIAKEIRRWFKETTGEEPFVAPAPAMPTHLPIEIDAPAPRAARTPAAPRAARTVTRKRAPKRATRRVTKTATKRATKKRTAKRATARAGGAPARKTARRAGPARKARTARKPARRR
jgi:methylmalonyl-CoA mutase C-terminal domain/subunit